VYPLAPSAPTGVPVGAVLYGVQQGRERKVSETIVVALLGGLAGSFITEIISTIRLSKTIGEDRRKDDLRYRREHLIEPVLMFTDDLIALIGETFWTQTDRSVIEGEKAAGIRSGEERPSLITEIPDALGERLANLRNREAAIEARVAAINDRQLTEDFHALTRQIWNVRRVGAKEGFGAAHEVKEEASALGAKVISALLRMAKNG